MSRQEIQYQVNDDQQVDSAMDWALEMIRKGLSRGPVLISLGRPRRTKDANRKLWPMLKDISDQVPWPIITEDGEESYVHLSPENWKAIFTANLMNQQIAPGISGGFVSLGASTSRMDKKTFSDLIELIYAFGAERDVVWSEPAKDAYNEYRKAA